MKSSVFRTSQNSKSLLLPGGLQLCKPNQIVIVMSRANRSEARWKPLQTFRNTPENHSKPCGHLCGGGRVHRQTATAAPCEHHLARGNSQTGEKKVTANPSWAFCLAVRLASQLSRRWTKINNFWFSGKQRCSAFQRAKNYWFWLSDEKVVTSWKKVLI